MGKTSMDFIVENGKAILVKVSFENIRGLMMTDLMTAVVRGEMMMMAVMTVIMTS